MSLAWSEFRLLLRWKSLLLSPCRCNSNKAVVTNTKRKVYLRQYPTIIVLPNGATIQTRYAEPRQIIKLPIDVSTLSPEELLLLKKRRKPKEVIVETVEIEDSFDKNKYSKYWKKK